MKKQARYFFLLSGIFMGVIVSTALSSEVAGIQGNKVTPRVVEWNTLSSSIEATALPEPSVIPLMSSPGPRIIHSATLPLTSVSKLETVSLPGIQGEAAAPSLSMSFSAVSDNLSYIPPDTIGAVGPSHLMTTLNGTVRIQDKTGGIISTVSLNSYWGKPSGVFDPKVYYDEDINRWITVACVSSQNANSAVLLGISSTNDPTGAWYQWSFDADGANVNWADYPGVGFNQKWIAISMNMFTVAANAFSGPKTWVLDKTTAMTGGVLTPTLFNPGFDDIGSGTGFTLIPCHTFGTETDLYILDSDWASGLNKFVRISKLTGAAATPSWSFQGYVDVQDYSSSFPDAPQFGTTTTIETNDTRVMNAVCRNGSLWYSQTGALPTTAPNRTVALWHQVSTDLTLIQEGAIDGLVGGTTTFYYFPSIAVTASNDVGIGFSGSNSGNYPSAYYANRRGTDPLNTFQSVSLMKAGEGIYTKYYSGTRNRWGDYSATVVDPVDGSLWTLQEYALAPSGSGTDIGRWGTWWGKFDASVPITLSSFVAE